MYSIVTHTFWRRRVICFFPRCNPTFNSFIFPCRESWKQLGEACLESSNDRDNVSVAVLSFKAKETVAAYDYEYLPSRFGPIQCYDDDVVCESPPNVTGAEIVKGLHKNGSYIGGSEVEYCCTGDSKEIIGNNVVRCLYSGKWSDRPVFKDRQSSNNLPKIFLPTLISVALSLLVVVIVVYIHRRRRNAFRDVILRSHREFDIYVCYAFDQDDDFVMNTILPE